MFRKKCCKQERGARRQRRVRNWKKSATKAKSSNRETQPTTRAINNSKTFLIYNFCQVRQRLRRINVLCFKFCYVLLQAFDDSAWRSTLRSINEDIFTAICFSGKYYKALKNKNYSKHQENEANSQSNSNEQKTEKSKTLPKACSRKLWKSSLLLLMSTSNDASLLAVGVFFFGKLHIITQIKP